jgi:hypothetical protein
MTTDEILNLSSNVEDGGSKEIVFVDESDRPCRVVDFSANGVVRIVLAMPVAQPPPEVVHAPGEFVIGCFHAGKFT